MTRAVPSVRSLVLAAACLVAGLGVAHAGTIPLARAADRSSGGSFGTFCLELGETFSSDTSCDASRGAQPDASGHRSDRIGTLCPAEGGTSLRLCDEGARPGGASSADALRRAIAFLEVARRPRPIAGARPGADRPAFAAPCDRRDAVWSGIGDVRGLSFTDGADDVQQDQLFIVPSPPASSLGLGLLAGIGAVAAWRRRRARVAV